MEKGQGAKGEGRTAGRCGSPRPGPLTHSLPHTTLPLSSPHVWSLSILRTAEGAVFLNLPGLVGGGPYLEGAAAVAAHYDVHRGVVGQAAHLKFRKFEESRMFSQRDIPEISRGSIKRRKDTSVERGRRFHLTPAPTTPCLSNLYELRIEAGDKYYYIRVSHHAIYR